MKSKISILLNFFKGIVQLKKDDISPEDLGWKSFAVTYSDLSAMGGGTPFSLYLSVGLPADLDKEYRSRLFVGMKSCVDSYGGHLLGGDTVKSDKIVINILAQGIILKYKLKLRSLAKPGDLLCLMRPIGNSELALKNIIENCNVPNLDIVKQSHYRPQVLFDEINWLSESPSVHAMIDISDGLMSEIKHICEASHCSAVLDLTKIPLTEELNNYLKKERGIDLSFSEEYTVLFTMEEDVLLKISQEFQRKFNRRIYSIGKIKARSKKNS